MTGQLEFLPGSRSARTGRSCSCRSPAARRVTGAGALPGRPARRPGRLASQFCRDHAPPRLDRPTATDRANGQPAFGSYAGDPYTDPFYTVGLVVLTLSDTRISPMTSFDTTTLPRFGLPASLPD